MKESNDEHQLLYISQQITRKTKKNDVKYTGLNRVAPYPMSIR
jgi:hypothetical protein